MNAQQLLSQTWRALVQRHAGAVPDTEVVLGELSAAYLEPGRCYHTLDHIAALLRQLDEHRAVARDADALALAIIFHDVVYDPLRHDNEARSAALARARLTSLAFQPA